MITIYAEKPDVARKIAAVLCGIRLNDGTIVRLPDIKKHEQALKSLAVNGYYSINWQGQETRVTWGYGHLCELCEAADYDESYRSWKNLPKPAFIPSEYRIKTKTSATKQFNIVKGLFNSSSLIINATDPDREGELIFALVYDHARCRTPFKRAYFTSQTESGILEAFNDLKDAGEVLNATNSGRARNIADWVVGCNLTVAMSLQNNNAGVLSIGRVQTPTLAILTERELAIRNFVSKPYYVVEATFSSYGENPYKATHKTERFDTRAEAEEIINRVTGYEGCITSITTKTTQKEAPSLCSLSVLQMVANSAYGFTLAKTLEIAQQLYEAGYITYPRTDSTFLTDDMEPTVNRVLDMLTGNPAYAKLITGRERKFNRSRYFNSSKVTSHFAIIPTHVPPADLTADQAKVYHLIAQTVIMMLYPPALIDHTTVITEVNGEEFVTTGSTIKDAGWMVVGGGVKDNTLLPPLSEGQSVSGEYAILDKMTQPPKRYTDKTLVAAMIAAGKDLDDDNLRKVMEGGVQGIGTEATRASIIETIVSRGYAERKNKTICATDKGIALINTIPVDDLKSAVLTAKWEEGLAKIASGEVRYEEFISAIEEQTRRWCTQIYSTTPSAAGLSTNDAIGKCPLCGRDVRMLQWGAGCTGYTDGCPFKISKIIAQKTLSKKNITDLITKGETDLIQGFTSKAGKPFDAMLIVEKAPFKISFAFPEKRGSADKRQGADREEKSRPPYRNSGWGSEPEL